VIHPVALYLGYVGFAVPFALVMGGLLARSPSANWVPAVRRWALIGWFFLAIGNLVGAWWAYVTLGWGGYWAWDPVENASLMPWLTATAWSMAVVMLRRRRMFWAGRHPRGDHLLAHHLRQRSHALWNSHLPPRVLDNTSSRWFTFFLIIGVIFFRGSHGVPPVGPEDSKAAGRPHLRESAFLYTNLTLVIIAFVVLWGVVFPTVAERSAVRKGPVGSQLLLVGHGYR